MLVPKSKATPYLIFQIHLTNISKIISISKNSFLFALYLCLRKGLAIYFPNYTHVWHLTVFFWWSGTGSFYPYCSGLLHWHLVNSPVSQLFFPLEVSSPNNIYELISRTTNCRLYSNISQIVLLYKTWGYYNKFESTKSWGLCYWYVKMPWCGCMEHGLEYITFYVQNI